MERLGYFSSFSTPSYRPSATILSTRHVFHAPMESFFALKKAKGKKWKNQIIRVCFTIQIEIEHKCNAKKNIHSSLTLFRLFLGFFCPPTRAFSAITSPLCLVAPLAQSIRSWTSAVSANTTRFLVSCRCWWRRYWRRSLRWRNNEWNWRARFPQQGLRLLLLIWKREKNMNGLTKIKNKK